MRKRDPSKPNPFEAARKARRYTREETRLQEEFVLNGIISGQMDRLIWRAFRDTFHTGRGRYNVLHARMLSQLAEDNVEKIKTAKAEAIQRTKRHLADLYTERQNIPRADTKALATHSAAIVKAEQFLADLTGAREPLKIEVNAVIKDTLQIVIANMTPEQMNQRLQRVREDRRLAEIARARIPGVIDTVGEAAQ